MGTKMIDRGVYDAAEVARLLAVTPDRVVRWATLAPSGLAPVVEPSFDRAFSFADLVALTVALDLRRRGVSDRDLRRGLMQLRSHFGIERPLADREVVARLATSGTS